jgi:atypical dual specificity phosphatase
MFFLKVTEISQNLFLTSIYGATKQNIKQRNITLLINAAQELPKMELQNVEVIKLFLDDAPHAMISVYFDRIADKINEHLTSGGRVLVHCVLGVSRSTSLCLAYYIKYRNMTLKQAFEHVSSKRPCVRPNPGFWRQLIDYEKRIFASKQSLVNSLNSKINTNGK